MGKKKGKQRGQYSTKAKNAAYQLEMYQYQHDHHYYATGKTNTTNTTPKTKIQNPELQKYCNEKRRNAVSLSVLRGMIRERLLEDRQRDANYRRHVSMNTNIFPSSNYNSDGRYNNPNAKIYNSDDACSNNEIMMTDKMVGWILTYNHREAMAGIEQPKYDVWKSLQDFNDDINCNSSHCNIVSCDGVYSDGSSLQLLCIKSLASHLQEYIDTCGEDYMIQQLSVLPSNIISSLSICCKNISDEIVYVLGTLINYHDVQGLVLNAAPVIPDASDFADSRKNCPCTAATASKNDCSSPLSVIRSKTSFTDNGLISLFHRNVHQLEESLLSSKLSSELDNWDDHYDLDHVRLTENHIPKGFMSSQNSINHSLKRFEIRNFQTDNAHTFLSFLQGNPSITHLSISQSFNAISGPRVLLFNDYNFNEEEGEDGYEIKADKKTILNILENLQVLDLSYCKWVHYDLLHLFTQRIVKNQNLASLIPLELVVIGNCCPYLTQDECDVLNHLTGGSNLRFSLYIP